MTNVAFATSKDVALDFIVIIIYMFVVWLLIHLQMEKMEKRILKAIESKRKDTKDERHPDD